MKRRLKKLLSTLAVGTTLTTMGMSTFAAERGVMITNPYKKVDWQQDSTYLANLHTHTTNSDGSKSQAEMLAAYQALRYDFLSFTDHDYITAIWPNHNINDGKIDPDKKGLGGSNGLPEINGWKTSDVLAIKGQEVSKTGWENHHFGSYFSDFVSDGKAPDTKTLLEQAAGFDQEGLQVMFHPGRYAYHEEGERYWNPEHPDYKNVEERFFKGGEDLGWNEVLAWYTDLFLSVDSLVGMEVLNYGNQYNRDIEVWDEVLTRTMPGRPVWGFANDDAHGTGDQVNRDMNFMVLEEKSVADFKTAMKEGNFYFSSRYTLPGQGFEEGGADRSLPLPKVTDIIVDEEKGTISIQGADYHTVTWISCGEVVGTGNTINYKNNPKIDRYIRAELTGEGGESFTQPFGIIK